MFINKGLGGLNLKTAEKIKNNSICVQDGEYVRNIKEFTDFNSQLVIVHNVPRDSETEVMILQKGEMARCISVNLIPKIIIQ